jgi:hypothetical protein
MDGVRRKRQCPKGMRKEGGGRRERGGERNGIKGGGGTEEEDEGQEEERGRNERRSWKRKTRRNRMKIAVMGFDTFIAPYCLGKCA